MALVALLGRDKVFSGTTGTRIVPIGNNKTCLLVSKLEYNSL